MRRSVDDASTRELPGGCGARAREDRERASRETHGCRVLLVSEQQRFFDPASAAKSARCRLWRAGLALWLAQAQLGPETGGHLNAAPRTNDSTPIASNQ